MKKTKSKAAAPAPAPKAASATKVVALKAAAKPAAESTAKPTTRKKIAAVPDAAKKPVAPVIKPGAPAPVATVITARINIGFGNTLYLRGQGSVLSWDRGVPLDCADDDCWTISLPETVRPVICKFLVNDLTWSAGSDYVVQPGSKVTLLPTF